MTDRPVINPGHVDWTGDNSGIYLKETGDGPYVVLASLFRVQWSPLGRGRALILVELPSREGSQALSLCLSDNDTLARWLIADFARHFQQFSGLDALDALDYRELISLSTSGDGLNRHVEYITGPDIEVELIWENLGGPFMVEMPTSGSATGRHDMFSLFIDARSARVTVNGRRLHGTVFPRDYAGRPSTTAFLAFSETWLRG